MLSRFSVVAQIDSGNGVSKCGEIPWDSESTSKYVRDLTVGQKRNAIVMGRKTYEDIPKEHRPLKDRTTVVISSTMKQEDHTNVIVCNSLLEALSTLAGSQKKYDKIFVVGGEQLFRDAIIDFGYLCDEIYVTRFKTDYGCDALFPWEIVHRYEHQDPAKTRDYSRFVFKPNQTHEESQYLSLLSKIVETGELKEDRTQTGTVSLFGLRLEFDISKRLPIITTKNVNYKTIIKELLYFLSGKSDTKILKSQGVSIWDENTSRAFLDKRGLEDYEPGDQGPMYGHQWRHWGAEYQGCDKNYEGMGIDQIQRVIDGLRKDPHGRRHIVSAYNVSDLDKMCLEPCHSFFQFNVSGDRKFLDCQLYQRSGDMFLGVPYNITSYCMLTYMIAHIVGLKPRKFVHVIGDAHIYANHIDLVHRQLSRTPRPFPKLSFRGAAKLREISDFVFDSFIVENYVCCPAINGKMAI